MLIYFVFNSSFGSIKAKKANFLPHHCSLFFSSSLLLFLSYTRFHAPKQHPVTFPFPSPLRPILLRCLPSPNWLVNPPFSSYSTTSSSHKSQNKFAFAFPRFLSPSISIILPPLLFLHTLTSHSERREDNK